MNNIRRATIKAIIDELTEKFETMKSEAIEKLEDIMSEEQEAYDNLPESFQYSERGEQMESGIDQIQTFIDNLYCLEIEGIDDLFEELNIE